MQQKVTSSKMLVLLLFLFFIRTGVPAVNNVRIKYERAEVTNIDFNVLANAFAQCNPYNRTTKGLNIRFKLKVDLDPDSTVVTRYFNFVSKEYKPFPIIIPLKIKDALQYELFDLQDLYLNCSKPQLKWPLLKMQQYEIKGYVPNARKFPNIPLGRYKVELHFTYNNKVFCVLKTYIKYV